MLRLLETTTAATATLEPSTPKLQRIDINTKSASLKLFKDGFETIFVATDTCASILWSGRKDRLTVLWQVTIEQAEALFCTRQLPYF